MFGGNGVEQTQVTGDGDRRGLQGSALAYSVDQRTVMADSAMAPPAVRAVMR